MTRAFQWTLYLLLLCLVPMTVFAQADCPTIVQNALDITDQACAATGRNQACYGNITLEATPRQGVADLAFDEAGDLAEVAQIESLRLSALDADSSAWGVALLKLQANLPDTLPGQNVTFLLFGDVQIRDAQADSPPPILLDVTATTNANVRGGPSTNDAVVGSLSTGQVWTADGRNQAGDWLRIQLEDESVGWVAARLLTIEGDLNTLPVMESDDSTPVSDAPEFGPMQAFTFRSGVDDAPCEQAPDSGILIQTPEGAGEVGFLVNEVNIQLGSTLYLQAGGGYMTVSVLEGRAQLTAFGVAQFVPAGSFARVPLGADGLASGAPEFPQPYNQQALQSLPLQVTVLETIARTPALTQDEIEAAVEAAQPPAPAGLWEWTWTLDPARTACEGVGSGLPTLINLTFNLDGSLTIAYTSVDFSFTWARTGEATYTYTLEGSSGDITATETFTITFTSPTTFSGERLKSQSNGCNTAHILTGTLISTP